jgi:hypothetical protein
VEAVVLFFLVEVVFVLFFLVVVVVVVVHRGSLVLHVFDVFVVSLSQDLVVALPADA